MIVIDANVVSEIVKPAPAKAVIEWFAWQKPRDLYTTTVTQSEILYGIELFAEGAQAQRFASGDGAYTRPDV